MTETEYGKVTYKERKANVPHLESRTKLHNFAESASCQLGFRDNYSIH